MNKKKREYSEREIECIQPKIVELRNLLAEYNTAIEMLLENSIQYSKKKGLKKELKDEVEIYRTAILYLYELYLINKMI